MSTDADAHKVGLIPVTLMLSGNIMGSGVLRLCPPLFRSFFGLPDQRPVLAGLLDW